MTPAAGCSHTSLLHPNELPQVNLPQTNVYSSVAPHTPINHTARTQLAKSDNVPAPSAQATPPPAEDGAIPPPCQPRQPGIESSQHTNQLAAIRDIWRVNCVCLDSQQQMDSWQVLCEYRDIFALNDNEVGLTHLVQHHIDTDKARSIKVHPRRLPMVQQEAADREVSAMLEAGINKPVVFRCGHGSQKKKARGGDSVDYRPLNKVTRKDCYPLPRVDDTLDLVTGSSWFSSLDLHSGYWQVRFTPESRPKTAFSIGREH